jgi:hypothetical protein
VQVAAEGSASGGGGDGGLTVRVTDAYNIKETGAEVEFGWEVPNAGYALCIAKLAVKQVIRWGGGTLWGRGGKMG